MINNKSSQLILKSLIAFVIIFALVIGMFIPQAEVANAAKDEDWVYNQIDQCEDIKEADEKSGTDGKTEKESKEDEGISANKQARGGDNYLIKGTEEYKLAKGIYDELTEDKGTSGAFAVGVIANIRRESEFISDIKEGEHGQSYAGRGYGLFQFTPAEKYTNSATAKKGKGPSDIKNQTAFMWESEFETRAVEAFFPRYNVKYKTVEDLASTDDINAAVRGFYAFERGARAEEDIAKSEAHAKKANAVFNKDDKKADPEKLKKSLGGSSKSGDSDKSKTDVDTSKEKDKDTQSDDEQKCLNGAKKKKKKDDDNFGASWGKDGTGDHKGIKAGNTFEVGWMPDQLPDSLKKYAIDPKKVGLGWKNPKNWDGAGKPTKGQCVNLSTSMFALVWTKDGKTPSMDKARVAGGNGNVTASVLAKLYGVKTTHKPSKGAVFSAPAFSPLGPTVYGHTGMVSHVFANGDVLILEQNIGGIKGGGSGEDGGHGNFMTWNYRLITKKAAETQTYVTMDGEKGWKVNEKLKK